jgi:hypothetical protein
LSTVNLSGLLKLLEEISLVKEISSIDSPFLYGYCAAILKVMTALKHAVLLTMSVLASYLFLQVPALRSWSLQVFAFLTLLYFIVQKKSGAWSTLWLPQRESPALPLLNAAILLLIGSSGSLESPFFILTFVQLFFLAMGSRSFVAILLAFEIAVFHFSMSAAARTSLAFNVMDWSSLFAIPLVMFFFVFAQLQSRRAYEQALMLDVGERALRKARSDDQAVSEFVQSLLNKRLPMFEFLLGYPAKNRFQLDAEMRLLRSDLQLLLRQLQQKQDFGDDDLSDMLEEVEEAAKKDEDVS